jgi:DNA-directed RNA polymerase subunit RPC12/RpoP
MRIVKHGNTWKTVECKNCGAVLEYSQGDILTTSFMDDAWGFYSECDSITCPDCKEKIILNERTIEI